MTFDKENKLIEVKTVGVPAVGTMSDLDFGIALKRTRRLMTM